jgi:NAD(P)-dependent dehydrogenase (short-subunit alcohol dehydrogenase family)
LRFAEGGADVAIVYRSDEKEALFTQKEIEALGRRAIIVRADVQSKTQVERAVAEVLARLHRIDVLVNNAGVISRAPFLELTEEQWDTVIDVDLKGTFLMSQQVARVMKQQGGGKIINVASQFAKNAGVNVAHYCAAKAGVSLLTKTMAIELAQYGINVNEVAPGITETDLNREDLARPEFLEPRLARIPLRRVGKPDDIAGAVAFLASDEASLVTGASIAIDGGATAW